MDRKSVDLTLSRSTVSERNFLSQVYFWMSMALALTGIVAFACAARPEIIAAILQNPVLRFGILIAQLGLVIWLSAAIMNISLMAATIGISIYATLNGLIFSSIFLVYTASSIASTFFATAGTFAAVSFYGYVTKRDLASIGSLSMMALIGLIIASIVNIFLKNSVFELIISYIGILVFIGLTAYDTQNLKRIHEQGFAAGETLSKMALLGALKLYLDFINMFLMFLRIFGSRRD